MDQTIDTANEPKNGVQATPPARDKAKARALAAAAKKTLIKPDTVKAFKSLHTWTGVGAGMALFIAFFAGALTVFHHELGDWDSYAQQVPREQTIAEAQLLVEQAILDEPGAAESLRLYLPGHHSNENEVYWYERLENDTFETHRWRMDDAGGIDTSLETAHVADFVYRLHYTGGLMPARLGLYALGIICVLYGLALFSGVLLFIPGFLKDLLVVRKGGKNPKRFWLDAHNVIGVVSLPFHILFAWSSAILAIGVFFLAPFQYLVFDDDLTKLVGPELGFVDAVEPKNEPAEMLSIAEVLEIVERELPGMEPEQVRFAHYGDAGSSVSVYGDAPTGTLVTGAGVTLNAVSGEVISYFDPAQATPGGTFYRGIMTLHFVDFGGYFVKWTFFTLSMLGAFLFYSGNLLFVESRRKRREQQQPGKAVLLAKLNSGVCIGAIAGIAMAMLASRFFSNLEGRADLTEFAYYTVFLLGLGWSIYRPVAKGTRDLLNLSALLCCAIPVVDATLIGMPLWKSFVEGHWSLFVIDVMALTMGVLFLRIARAVSHRSKNGPANSVWYNRPTDREAQELVPNEVSPPVAVAVAKN
ncbi:MAG: PepSY-associated TM helix domain-containing protein [Pseudomonadota bacterium]